LTNVCAIIDKSTNQKKPFKILAPLVQYILYFLDLCTRDFID
jgi:hypothetical protein